MVVETHQFDGARFITSREAEAEFIRDALDTGDHAHLAHVVSLIARARGVAIIADELGVPSDAVFDALNGSDESSPTLRKLAEQILSRIHSQNAAAE